MRLHTAKSIIEVPRRKPHNCRLATFDAEHLLTYYHDPQITEEGMLTLEVMFRAGVKVGIVSDCKQPGFGRELQKQIPHAYVRTVREGEYKYRSPAMFLDVLRVFDVPPMFAMHSDDQSPALRGAALAGFAVGVLVEPNSPGGTGVIRGIRLIDRAVRYLIESDRLIEFG